MDETTITSIIADQTRFETEFESARRREYETATHLYRMNVYSAAPSDDESPHASLSLAPSIESNSIAESQHTIQERETKRETERESQSFNSRESPERRNSRKKTLHQSKESPLRANQRRSSVDTQSPHTQRISNGVLKNEKEKSDSIVRYDSDDRLLQPCTNSDFEDSTSDGSHYADDDDDAEADDVDYRFDGGFSAKFGSASREGPQLVIQNRAFDSSLFPLPFTNASQSNTSQSNASQSNASQSIAAITIDTSSSPSQSNPSSPQHPNIDSTETNSSDHTSSAPQSRVNWGRVKEVSLTGIEACRSLAHVIPLLTAATSLELKHTNPHTLSVSIIEQLSKMQSLERLATDDVPWETVPLLSPNVSPHLSRYTPYGLSQHLTGNASPNPSSNQAGSAASLTALSANTNSNINLTAIPDNPFLRGVCLRSHTLPSSLRALHLRRARIASLPMRLPYKCPSLRELHLPHNSLLSLPPSYSTMYRLKSLHLSHNSFTDIPMCIFHLTRLHDLHLPFNNISQIPEYPSPEASSTSNYSASPQQNASFGLGRLIRLRSLHLHHNKLTSLPASLSALPSSLRDLHLHHNKLTELPSTLLSSLPQLRHLHLASNQLSGFAPDIPFASIASLYVLDLHDNQITSLPFSITALTQITRMNLDQNRLTTLLSFQIDHCQEKVPHVSSVIFPRLRVLTASKNQLQSIFTGSFELPQLRQLDVSFNRLSQIPDTICNWTCLSILNISINRISSIPDHITRLSKMQTLFVQGNLLSTLPESIGELPSLQVLTLGAFTPDNTSGAFIEAENQLSSLPNSFGKLTSLQRLLLRYNRFTALPDCVTDLSSLTMFSIENNSFTPIEEVIWNSFVLRSQSVSISKKMPTIPTCIQKLKDCRELILHKSKFTELPNELLALTGLTSLHLTENKLSTLSTTYFCSFENLCILNLSKNTIHNVTDEFQLPASLEEFVADHNQISAIPLAIISLPGLAKLSLEGNTIRDAFVSPTSTPFLKHLNLSQNQLSEIPPWVFDAGLLTELQLWRNRISILPDAISRLCRLQILTFGKGIKSVMDQVMRQLESRSNFLSVLPPCIGQLSELQELDLSFNQLSALPDTLTTLTSLSSFSLIRNQMSDVDTELWTTSLLRMGTVKFVGSFTGPLTFPHTLPHIRHLTLNHVPSSFVLRILRKVHNIQTLVLEMNEPLVLPPIEVFAHLTQLRSVNMTGCSMQNIPHDFAQLNLLRDLHICHNRLSTLASDFGRLTALERLCIDNNPIHDLPASFSLMQNLQLLSARSMGLATFCEPLATLTSLQTVLLGHNQISRISESISRLTNLRSLHLNHNRLYGTLVRIHSLQGLQELHLNGNQLTQLDHGISSLRNLAILRLDENHFASWPSSLQQLRGLTELSLARNRISFILGPQNAPDGLFYL
eukprot:TRINITY_DN9158_c0_g1_i1.p1 TRINITY_DN9158_c0_g1~~TRINITY_DN9158_c0_g1_i1.p1  ORF type:complete len:1413 (+),score=301.18 TRINITY_DN9158_c0_g1_i1:45-4283(+)